MFKSHGCISAYLAVSNAKDAPEMIIISTWENKTAIEKLRGKSNSSGVILPESSQFLEGKPVTEYFDVVGTL